MCECRRSPSSRPDVPTATFSFYLSRPHHFHYRHHPLVLLERRIVVSLDSRCYLSLFLSRDPRERFPGMHRSCPVCPLNLPANFQAVCDFPFAQIVPYYPRSLGIRKLCEERARASRPGFSRRGEFFIIGAPGPSLVMSK